MTRSLRQRTWLPGGCALLLAWAAQAATPHVTWHHDRSPYRAEFEITSQPNHPEAGLAVAVPVCGLGLEEGGDLLAYDDAGAQLAILPLGNGTENRALAQVRPDRNTQRVFVYFGSGARAPRHTRAFVPTLTVDIRTLPAGPFDNWQQVDPLVRKSERIALLFSDDISLAYNPADSTDSFIMVFEGALNVQADGDQTLMLVSDDAGFLFVSDKLVLERGGRQWAHTAQRGECRVAVPLKKGAAPLRFVVVEAGGTQMALLARWVNEKSKSVLQAKDFVQAGRTNLVRVEPRHDDLPCPAFQYKALSYMSYKGAQFTEVRCGLFPGAETGAGATEWSFGDGARLKGETVTRVIPGLATRRVTVRQRRAEAKGTVAFPETVPPERPMNSADDAKRYTALILSQNLKDLDVSTLRGYLVFLNYTELNEDAIPVYEAIVGSEGVARKDLTDALQGLARAAAKSFPDRAEKAYAALFREAKGKGAEAAYADLAREYADFLLYRQRQPDQAAKAIERAAEVLPASDKDLLFMRLHLALQKGDAAGARTCLDRILGRRETGSNQRFAAVKGSALRQRYEDLMAEGFLLDARDALREWEDLAADDLLNGSLALARAKYWEALGWYGGALGELEGAILLEPLLPNLPDVEYERAWVCLKAGDRKKAEEILTRIVKEFPNHPVAAKAKGYLP